MDTIWEGDRFPFSRDSLTRLRTSAEAGREGVNRVNSSFPMSNVRRNGVIWFGVLDKKIWEASVR